MFKSAEPIDYFFNPGNVDTQRSENLDSQSNFSGRLISEKTVDKDTSYTRAKFISLANEEESLTATPLSARSVKSPPNTPSYAKFMQVRSRDTSSTEQSQTINRLTQGTIGTNSGEPAIKIGKREDTSTLEVLKAEFITREEDRFHLLLTTRDKVSGLLSSGLEEMAYGDLLALGGYAKITAMVKEAQSQIKAESIVFKHAKKKKGIDSVNDVYRDFENSLKINGKGQFWGIKPPPICKITLPGLGRKGETKDGELKNPANREGYLEIKYDTDLKKMIAIYKRQGIFFPIKEALHIGHQVMSGIGFMHQEGIIDNDRKLDNILMKKEGDFYLAHLSDWGGARFKDEWEGDLKEFTKSMAYTSVYTSRLDYKLSKLYIADNNVDKFFELEAQKLTFSAGLMLYMMFTNQQSPYPYVLGSNRKAYLCVTKPLKPISDFRPDLHPDLQMLIHDMLEPDYRDRPTPEQAKSRFDNILAANFPEVNAKIESDMAKLGYLIASTSHSRCDFSEET